MGYLESRESVRVVLMHLLTCQTCPNQSNIIFSPFSLGDLKRKTMEQSDVFSRQTLCLLSSVNEKFQLLSSSPTPLQLNLAGWLPRYLPFKILSNIPRHPVIRPAVWCFRYVFGVPSQEMFGCLGHHDLKKGGKQTIISQTHQNPWPRSWQTKPQTKG